MGFGGKVVLELERPAGQQGLHLFQVGKNAALFGNVAGRAATDRPTLNGVITSVRRNKLLLATTKEDLPDWVTEGRKLGIDLTFDEVSYREMDYALGKVMGPTATAWPSCATSCWGPGLPASAPKSPTTFSTPAR
ncbi:MAG: hypothetical protein WKG07_49110 [Hymenobacter sp.]